MTAYAPLLMGVQTCTAALEISMFFSQKIRNQSTSSPSNTTFGYIPKECSIIPYGHLLTCVHIMLFIIEPGNNLDVPWLKNG